MCETPRPSKSGKYLTAEEWDALKGAGFTDAELYEDQPTGPIIFAYTRADAIRDGVLVDVTHLARRAGFTIHTAMTCGVAAALMELVRKRRPEDFEKYTEGRIRNAAVMAMLQTLREEIDRQKDVSDRLHFECSSQKLWAHIGPGDDGEAVLTLMLEGED